jgi:3-dehydroquinate dehydratase type I
MIEIRFDLLKPDVSALAIREATDLPMIATNRRKDEGGLFSGSEKARTRVLMQAAEEGFDYVDVELSTKGVDALVRQLQQKAAKVIVSHHNTKTTPPLRMLERLLRKQRAAGADICKIVTHAKRDLDNVPCLALVNKHASNTKLVCFAMGEAGVLSRVMSPILGAYFTYASSDAGRETAAGQLPVNRIKAIYRELGVT